MEGVLHKVAPLETAIRALEHATTEDLKLKFEKESLRVFSLKREYEEAARNLYAIDSKLKSLSNGKPDIEKPQVTSSHDNDSACEDEEEPISANFELLDPKTLKLVKQRAKKTTITKSVRIIDSHFLSHICIVLVRTEGPINIGQICRFAANLGVADIRLVNPQCDHRTSEARRFAHHARPLLALMPVYSCIRDATSDCSLVVATSGREMERQLPGCELIEPQQLPHCAALAGLWTPESTARVGDGNLQESVISDHHESGRREATEFACVTPRVAILFGNEANGLTHQEIEGARYLMRIPTRGAYPSLNLGFAVAVVLYALWLTGKYASPTVSTVPAARGVLDTQAEQPEPDASSTGSVSLHKTDAADEVKGTDSKAKKKSTQLAPAGMVELLRELFVGTLRDLHHPKENDPPGFLNEQSSRLARRVSGSLTVGEANFLIGALKWVRKKIVRGEVELTTDHSLPNSD